MKRSVLFMALLSLAVQASAAPVTVEQAKSAASAWAARGGVLGARFGASVERASALSLGSGATVYAVKMAGGGSVFVAADDDLGAVVAFTAATNDFSAIDVRSPLWALLSRDAEVRAFARTNAAAKAVASTKAASAKASPSTASVTSAPDDLRVAPLVKSKWDQTTANGKLCYNRFTPVLKTGEPATCGCVATAMAQIMRYHEFPSAEVAPVTRTCYVNMYAATKAKDPDCIANLTTQAGVYDWAGMALVPEDGVTDAQCDAIGRLTSDAGISVYMNYGSDAYGSSGAFVANVAKALTDVFGYADADYYCSSEVSSSSAAMRKGLFANLDSGLPVLLGIASKAKGLGHAIVGDGYGYEGGLAYVHLNMGWSGQDDYWYNLPDIGTYYSFDTFDEIVLNIVPEDADGDLLTGRVTDDDGEGLAGVAVSVCATGASAPVATGETSATGVYAFRVPAGTYDLAFEKAGLPAETLESVKVAKTQTRSWSFSGTLRNDTTVTWSVSYSGVPFVTSFGNSWGNDVTLTVPRARIVLGAVTNVYATLDTALAAAKAIVAAGAPGVAVELLDKIPLAATATIDFPCALTAAGADPAAAPVVRSGNAALAVAAGGALALSNVTFKANAAAAVTVEAGGTLALASGVDFGVPSTVAAVRTADAAGLVLAGALTAGFAIDCAAAAEADDVFGTALCDVLTASDSAARVANAQDTFGETRGVAVASGESVLLKWSEIPVPMSESAGYFVDASGATNTAARLDRLLAKYANMRTAGAVGEAGEVVVRAFAGLELSTRFAVPGDLTLRGETAGVTVASFGEAAGFDVGEGAKLTVRDLAFDGYRGDSLFRVDGGELALGGNVSLSNVAGTNTYSGAVAVLAGTATVGSADGPVVFEGCANGMKNSKGGAIFLKGSGCELVLRDRVVVTNCQARSAGGGVYVGKGAGARLSGYLTVRDNAVVSSASKSSPSDVGYCRTSDTAAHTLVLAGPLETGSAVGVRGEGAYAGSVSKAGGTFMAVDAAFADHAKVLQSCERLFCDTDETLAAEPADGYATLLWAADDGGIKPVDPSAAVASVTGADGVIAYYGSLSDAFGVVKGDATVTLLADADLSDDILVTNAVTLTSGEGGPFTVFRAAACRFAVRTNGALTVTRVTVSGELDDFRFGTGALFDVQYGELTLGDGATVRGVTGGSARTGGAVKLYRGLLTMLDGSEIVSCEAPESGGSCGGAVTADTFSRVRLLGGTVAYCTSDLGGGVYVGNESTVEVGGGFVATDNGAAADGSANNVYVAAKSALLLVSPFTGRVGYVPGVSASSVVFGRVASAFSGTAAEAADSAHNFTHDLTGDVGIAAKPASGAGETLLVWSDALDADGAVAVDGTNYVAVAGGATLTTEIVDVETAFTYDGTAKRCLSYDHGYVLACEPQTNAGTYAATATPKAGFAWADDGTTAPRTVSWTIEKAVYDMSGVTFEDRTVAYDGKAHSLAVSGTLPDGVTVAYDGNGQTEAGEYVVTATFTGDAVNYEAIPALTATLTIVEETPGPGPEPDPPAPSVETNSPTPIAFESIARLSETSWRLVVTNRVPWCWYRLLSTDDLTAGFVTTNEWEQAPADATPAWTNDVETSGAALFWKAEGKEGEVGE